jgi:K+-transporting ATPase A subunit
MFPFLEVNLFLFLLLLDLDFLQILCIIGDVIVASSSFKEYISKFKLDERDESTKVFLMRIFTLFHVLGNSSNSHKRFYQANALFVKALAMFLSFLLSHIRRCLNFLSIPISQAKYLLESKPSKKEGMEGYNNLLWK